MASQGFGCMGFSALYGSAKKTTDEQAISVIHHAIERQVAFLNSASFYGPLNEEGFGANLRLIRKCIEGIDRSTFRLMVKIGMDTRAPMDKTGQQWINRADTQGIRDDVDYTLRELGVDFIDIIVLCRVSPTVPIEESIAAMQALVSEGKAKHIGISEANGETIRRAHAVHPLYCIEQEWSLWTRDIEAEIVPTCRELGIKIVAYSPLGRGFLTGTIRDRASLDPTDFRLHGQPRLAAGNIDTNLKIVDDIQLIANRKSCTVGQLSLAWLHAQGPDVIPIPGTTSLAHLDDNLHALTIHLTGEDLAEIEAVLAQNEVAGDRYAHMAMTFHGNAKK